MYRNHSASDVNSFTLVEHHLKLTRQTVEESVVILKNAQQSLQIIFNKITNLNVVTDPSVLELLQGEIQLIEMEIQRLNDLIRPEYI